MRSEAQSAETRTEITERTSFFSKCEGGIKKIFVAILVVLFSANIVLATESVELPNAGLTPESPFYFLDTWGEKISLAFTFKAEKKAEKMQKFAEEKLAEAKKMAEDKKTEIIEKALKNYENYLENAVDKINEVKEQGKNVEETLTQVAEATQKHLIVLAEVYEKVPEQAKDAILNAMEKSSQGQENALKAISGEKKKEAEEKVEKVKEKYQSSETQNNKGDGINKQCVNKGGAWSEKYQECGGISKEECSDLGGKYDGCASPCRHDSNATECIASCKQVCSF